MTSTGANTAAIAAALGGPGQSTSQFTRHSLAVKGSGNGRGSDSAFAKGDAARHGQSHVNLYVPDNALEDDDLMQDDGIVVDGMPRGRTDTGSLKARSRRASEGAHLSKGDGKRASGELRCEKCGKGYKHSSCLTKHLSVPCVSYPFLSGSSTNVTVAFG